MGAHLEKDIKAKLGDGRTKPSFVRLVREIDACYLLYYLPTKWVNSCGFKCRDYISHAHPMIPDFPEDVIEIVVRNDSPWIFSIKLLAAFSPLYL